MKHFAVGIDLGTTHTVVGCARLPSDDVSVFSVPQYVTEGSTDVRALLPSCLYAPLEVEAPALPGPWVVGEFARKRAVEVPARTILSSKSWLSNSKVDRTECILPWGADASEPKLSPEGAAAEILAHVRKAWDEAHPEAPLAEQIVVLTVPASFDEVARELTVRAAKTAGLVIRLLEEPTAAFTAYMQAAPDVAKGRTLVCDIGGGTTDLSIIGATGDSLERMAVGSHLLLGGDNMDLALAHACEARWTGMSKLGMASFSELVASCRAAKERLLAGRGDTEVRLAVAERGSRLVGKTRATTLTVGDVEQIVLDGFLPLVSREERPARPTHGLVGLGLPYERDPAITRHIAAFLAKHDAFDIDNVLFNGGVFHAALVAERVLSCLRAWKGGEVLVLPSRSPDTAVAVGATVHAQRLASGGQRVSQGSPRSYYVEVAAQGDTKTAVCVLPRGAKEESHISIDRPELLLTLGTPRRFAAYSRSDPTGHVPGDVTPIDGDFDALPPLCLSFPGGTRKGKSVDVPVHLEVGLTPVGTLELAFVESRAEQPRRFELSFLVRGDAAESVRAPASARIDPEPLRLADGRIQRAFATNDSTASLRDVKDLVRDLERILGDRKLWPLGLARELSDRLLAHKAARHRSAEHERVFFQLLGFCLRPGVGDPRDAERVRLFLPTFAERIKYGEHARSWQAFWIAFRRIVAGLEQKTQESMRDLLDPFVAPASAGLKKSKKFSPEGLAELIELLAALERVPAARREALGEWLVERTFTDASPLLWASIGKIGARIPAYASLHYALPAHVVERWLEVLLRDSWDKISTAARAAAFMARKTGDRSRDVSDEVALRVAKRLRQVGAKEHWAVAVEQIVPPDDDEKEAWFGDALPPGLRLCD